MSFLNPLFLFGLAAAALPILIHLFTRTRSRTIPFSTLNFLKELQNQQVRRLKLRQILLLILRTLAIMLLIFAFARPILRGALSGATSPNAKTSMVIILDNSVSMTRPLLGRSLFDAARDKAADITEVMLPGDEVFLVTTTDTTAESARPFHDADFVKKAVSEIQPNFHATDISAALDYAQRILARSSNVNKEIYLISDVQESAFTADSLRRPAENMRLFVLPITPEKTTNLAIEHAQLVSTILETGKVAEAAVTIANTGDRDVNNALAQLSLNGKRVAQLSVQLAAGAATTEVFRFTLEKSGFSIAQVELEDDDILDDNTRAFVFDVPEQLTIGLAGYKPADTYYAELVLDPQNIGPAFYAVRNVPLPTLRSMPLADFNVLLLSNIPAFDQQSADRLAEFVQEGGGLVLVLGEDIDIRAYNSTLVPALQLPQFIDVIGALDGEQPDFSLGEYDLTHPIFSGVFENKEAEITNPRFHFAVKVAPSADIDPIMSYSSGDPLIFEKKLGQGLVLVMTTGFGPQLSDITRRTIFAPLLTRMVGYAGTARSNITTSLLVGEEIRYKINPADVNKTLEMRRPDDKYDRLKPTMTPGGAWIYYSQTDFPGVYELVADGAVANVWAVQLDARESRVRVIDKNRLAQNYHATVLSENAQLVDFILSQRRGTELWKYFALAAFVLLLVEMLLYREKGEAPIKESMLKVE